MALHFRTTIKSEKNIFSLYFTYKYILYIKFFRLFYFNYLYLISFCFYDKLLLVKPRCKVTRKRNSADLKFIKLNALPKSFRYENAECLAAYIWKTR